MLLLSWEQIILHVLNRGAQIIRACDILALVLNRRNKLAETYATTHQLDTKLVCKLLNKDELLYDDDTKSISIDMKYMEDTDIDSNIGLQLKYDNKLPIELNERIITTKMKNDHVQKFIRMPNDEIAKLWLCREFMFRNDHFVSQQSSSRTTDMRLTTTNKTDSSNIDNHDVIKEDNEDNEHI